MRPYERFLAWRHCHALALAVYEASSRWPSNERFGLTSQARRAAFSSAANIAEGSAKRGPREFRRYLDITLGSLAELTYALRLARDLGYIDQGSWKAIDDLSSEAGRTTWALYRQVQDSA